MRQESPPINPTETMLANRCVALRRVERRGCFRGVRRALLSPAQMTASQRSSEPKVVRFARSAKVDKG